MTLLQDPPGLIPRPWLSLYGNFVRIKSVDPVPTVAEVAKGSEVTSTSKTALSQGGWYELRLLYYPG